VDPLFSTGFPLTLLGIHRLAGIAALPAGEEREARLREYAAATMEEAEASSLLVGGCYAAFRDFPRFAGLSMLYFTAASFSEMARRLNRPHLASRFLLQNCAHFREAFRRHLDASLAGSPPAPEAVAEDLEPYNIAGLCDPARRNWYPVELEDVVRGAAKLEQTPAEVRAFFRRMGWDRTEGSRDESLAPRPGPV
jgi:FADH2 O2-dependent halogenase